MGVFVQAVMLDFPDAVEAELLGELCLLEAVMKEGRLLLRRRICDLQLEEQGEFQGPSRSSTRDTTSRTNSGSSLEVVFLYPYYVWLTHASREFMLKSLRSLDTANRMEADVPTDIAKQREKEKEEQKAKAKSEHKAQAKAQYKAQYKNQYKAQYKAENKYKAKTENKLPNKEKAQAQALAAGH